jgi:hypothetical protein
MQDLYAYWRDALAGTFAPITADHPQPGRYKMRKGKDGPYLPVAIFLQDDVLKAAVGKEFTDPLKVWTWCADKPVSEADYKQAMATGQWPGDVDIGHNSGDLSLKDEIEDRASSALEWLAKNGIKSKVDADTAANHRAALLELKKRAETEHKAEKAPHLDAGKKVDAKYKPLIETADGAGATLRTELGKYLAKVEAEETAKKRAAYEAEQAAVKAKWLAEAAERAKKMEADPIAALTDPAPELPTLPTPPESVKVSAGGQRGRVTGLKTVVSYMVTDYAKTLAFFATNDEVRELVEKLAARAGKAGVSVPGVEKKEERVAA